MHFPLTQKHVVLDTDRQLQYYVNGCHVNTQETELEQMYNTADLMPYILEKFQKMNVCSGLGDMSTVCPLIPHSKMGPNNGDTKSVV